MDLLKMQKLVISLHKIRTIQNNKDKVICCPEQIAYYHGWITKDQLEARAKLLGKNTYGKYLQKVFFETK